MSVVVSIALATICFTYNGTPECHPVLLGNKNSTPVGEFAINRRITASAGYGGDVLQFYETPTTVYAIHRVWTLKPEQHRNQRLKSTNIEDRYISKGCVNVAPDVYDKLAECCTASALIIK
jgi:hypothetical protein